MTRVLKEKLVGFDGVEDGVLLESGADPFDEESGETFLWGVASRGLASSVEEKLGGDRCLFVCFSSTR